MTAPTKVTPGTYGHGPCPDWCANHDEDVDDAYHWGETRKFVDNVGHEAGSVRAELVTSAKHGTDRIVAIGDDHFDPGQAREYAAAILAACDLVEAPVMMTAQRLGGVEIIEADVPEPLYDEWRKRVVLRPGLTDVEQGRIVLELLEERR
jgi:hypothetical protein